jgi:hypothetical protein
MADSHENPEDATLIETLSGLDWSEPLVGYAPDELEGLLEDLESAGLPEHERRPWETEGRPCVTD